MGGKWHAIQQSKDWFAPRLKLLRSRAFGWVFNLNAARCALRSDMHYGFETRDAVRRAPCDFAYGVNWQLNQQCMVSNLGDPGPCNDPTALGKDRCTCLFFPSIGDLFIRPEHKFDFQLDWFIFTAPDSVPG